LDGFAQGVDHFGSRWNLEHLKHQHKALLQTMAYCAISTSHT